MSLSEAEVKLKQLPVGWTEAQVRDAATKHLKQVVILKTRWYSDLMNSLEQSARDYLAQYGIVNQVITQEVPGSFELPLSAQWAYAGKLSTQKGQSADFVLALGCVIKGDTPHFDYVCGAATDGLLKAHMKASKPLGFGVLTVNTQEQAQARKNKGAEAAQACLEMWLSQLAK